MRLRRWYKRGLYLALLAMLLLWGIGCTASKMPEEQLLGEWVGVFEDEPLTMVFLEDGLVAIIEFGEETYAFYAVDFSYSPAHLNFLLDGIPLDTIIEFVDDDTMRFENNLPFEPRPTGFSETAETITLTRK